MAMKKLSEDLIRQLKEKFFIDLKKVDSFESLEALKILYLGRKGEIRKLFHQLKDIDDIDERKRYGEILNSIVVEIEEILEKEFKRFKKDKEEYSFSLLEMSLPSANFQIGKIHPLQKVYNEIIEIFSYLGFDIQEGPEIEFEDYNFTMLNIPDDHPARDMQDTLYLNLPKTDKGKILLRTHTSPVQIRLMLSKKPPIKSIMPGRVFRNENLDATHSFNFHQVEGLVVDKNIKLSDLKGTLIYFVRLMFYEDIVCKFRQSYFPFTEPSLELDIQCLVCKGSGCSVCKYSGFVEILGCGMVHPQVLYNVGLGYEEYTGFAFGLGVERVTMLKYRIDNMRLFYENDLRFIKQF